MSMDDASFGIEKLKLQGAVCKANQLSVSASIVTDLQVRKYQNGLIIVLTLTYVLLVCVHLLNVQFVSA